MKTNIHVSNFKTGIHLSYRKLGYFGVGKIWCFCHKMGWFYFGVFNFGTLAFRCDTQSTHIWLH